MASIKSDLLELKNGPPNLNENYSINIDHVKNKMGRGRGRPPKNSYSSSGSTCSENSNKDPYSFKSSSSSDESEKYEKNKNKSFSGEQLLSNVTHQDANSEIHKGNSKINRIASPKKTSKVRRKSAPTPINIPLLINKRIEKPLTPPKSSASSTISTISSSSKDSPSNPSPLLSKAKTSKIDKSTLASEIVQTVIGSVSDEHVETSSQVTKKKQTPGNIVDVFTPVNKTIDSPKPIKRARSSSTSKGNLSINQAKKLKKTEEAGNNTETAPVNTEETSIKTEETPNNTEENAEMTEETEFNEPKNSSSLETKAKRPNRVSLIQQTKRADKSDAKKGLNAPKVKNQKRHSICGNTDKLLINIKKEKIQQIENSELIRKDKTKLLEKTEPGRVKKEKVKPVEKTTGAKKRGRKTSKIEVNDEDDEENDEEENEVTLNDTKQKIPEIEVEFSKLQPIINVSKANICYECELKGEVKSDLIECKGGCQRFYHLDCGILEKPIDAEGFKCKYCRSNSHDCFTCKKTSTVDSQAKKCSFNMCGRYFHDECTKLNKLFRFDTSNPNKTTFICPTHTCVTCWIDMSHNINETIDHSCSSTNTPFKGKLLKCTLCTNSYHASEHCVPAGSLMANVGPNLRCPSHFMPLRKIPQHTKVNVSWCFVCCETGKLIGCKTCPASYHYDCLENPPPASSIKGLNEEESENRLLDSKQTNLRPDSPASELSAGTSTTMNSENSSKHAANVICSEWMCEDCQIGKKPLYGQIVWSKVGGYRWWPAQVCHPRNLPENLKIKSVLGEFPVKFFGTNDFYWVTIGRTFAFAEGDEEGKRSGGSKALQNAYAKGVEAAITAFKEVQRLKMNLMPKSSNDRQTNLSRAMKNFTYIRTNKPFGNVKVNKVPISELPCCNCDPKSAKPCSTNDCVNRALKYECHPAVCPAGEQCNNQRFVKRQYPKQEPMPCGGRGWGLRTGPNTIIKKGDFVNEYVGELIELEECKRRLKHAKDNDITSFYFLTIDKDRVIDAGPKGNLARFMNHSCDPNVETQKWDVNGDIRIGLFALTDIPAETELTFNYNFDCMSNEKAPCKCGSKNCSGFIGDFPKNNRLSTINGIELAKSSNSKSKEDELQITTEQITDSVVVKGRKSEAPNKAKSKKGRKSIA